MASMRKKKKKKKKKKRGLDASVLSARSGSKMLVLQKIEEDQDAEQEESDSNIKQQAESEHHPFTSAASLPVVIDRLEPRPPQKLATV